MILEELNNEEALNCILGKEKFELSQWKYVDGLGFIAIKDDFDLLVGMIAYSEDTIEDNTIVIDVFEIIRGNRKSGFGESAYKEFERLAKKEDYKMISLIANDDNAKRFWEKQGFYTDPDHGDGAINMFKRLDDQS